MTKRQRKQVAKEVEGYLAERGGILNHDLAKLGAREFSVPTLYGQAWVGVVDSTQSGGTPWLWLQFKEPGRAAPSGCSRPSGKLNLHTTREMDAGECIAAMKQHLSMVGV